ncbi:MAG: aminoglycoside phosphotransferase family protein [Chloroflexota bacterium]|nr:aminoglycoside phosphotransferase family protein [Chloroflexota bacterium]
MLYRCSLAIYDPTSDSFLLDATDGRSALPVVQAVLPWPWTGAVGPVNEAVSSELGISVITLRAVPTQKPRDAYSIGAVFFMEHRREAGARTLPSRGVWVSREDLGTLEFASASDRLLLANFMREVDAPDAPALRTPWSQVGWFAEACTWAESELEQLGRRLVAPVEQMRQWSISSILRFPTDRGDAWFKAVPSFFAHESALMRSLSAESPHVPVVLASNNRRGWTLMEAVEEVDAKDTTTTIADALRVLARLQMSWIGRTEELISLGCPDRRLATLPDEVQALMQRDELRNQLDARRWAQLEEAIEVLPESCSALAHLGVPETLIHGDFHPGNVMMSDGRIVLIDWTDGCIGHPFFDLATVLPNDGVARTTLLRAYIEVWEERFHPEDVRKAFSVSDALACLHHAVSYQRIVDGIEPETRWGLGGAVGRWFERFLDKLEASNV